MGIINQMYMTVACDGIGCDKLVTFETNGQGGIPIETLEKNPWLKTRRLIQTADQRVITYCSDVCEVKGIETGDHNAPEPKQIVSAAGGTAAIAAAAAAERQKKIAEEKLKAGEPVRLQLS